MDKTIREEDFIPVIKQNYFVQIENEFIKNINYTITEKMVYLCLCTYAGKNISCFPGQNGIAKDLGISRRTVLDTIKSLEKKKGLVVIKQVTETNRKTVNQYILADIDKTTGSFDESSLSKYECFKDNVIRIKGK